MAAKWLDKRFHTRGGGSIRVEVWGHRTTRAVTRYNLAYVNRRISNSDNGRVVGFDNSHVYPGFRSAHHCHWFGRVLENCKFRSFEQTSDRFERLLRWLKRRHEEEY